MCRVCDLEAWVGKPPVRGAIFHGWPSRREAAEYLAAAGVAGGLVDRTREVRLAAGLPA